jgi:D-alanyl-D-alanine carboxypeptidase
VHYLSFPFLRKLAFAVAILSTPLIAAAPAAAEATLVVEADSGKVLFANHATDPWYPASTSKLMTLYLTLRAVKEHRLNLDTLLTVSSNAVAQAPSKMGLPAGTQVTVDNALKMMMVHSANDIAVVLAESVGGSIEKFADEMNAASRRLGMTQSSWVNPNGLPAEEQITSARDMAILARAIWKEVPEYEMYWHIPSIKFGRRVMRNTNGLIGRSPEVDGMKTGFICASGFNVVATATRGGRKLIVVVFGSHSGAARSEKAAQLFEKGFASGGLNWLLPTLGTVDTLQPIAAAPVNMKDEICGKHRKRPASDDEEVNDSPQAGNPDVDQSSAFSITNSLGAKPVKGALLGPVQPSVPIIVYTGPQRGDGGAGLDVAAAVPKRKKKVNIATAPDGKPKTVNAGSGFAPAAADTKPVAAPSDTAAKSKVKKKKVAAKKTDAGKPEEKAVDTKREQ